jgi:hypothetical protein
MTNHGGAPSLLSRTSWAGSANTDSGPALGALSDAPAPPGLSLRSQGRIFPALGATLHWVSGCEDLGEVVLCLTQVTKTGPAGVAHGVRGTAHYKMPALTCQPAGAGA